MGRHALPDDKRRDQRYEMRFTRGELVVIHREAQRAGLLPAQWIRVKLGFKLEQIEVPDATVP